MSPRVETIGTLPDGREVRAWRLGDPDGLELTVLDWGARTASLRVPTAGGRREVMLGLDGLQAWLADDTYLGAIAGRYANRIGGAGFTLDGRHYRLPANNGTNTLHGGPGGFSHCLWNAAPDGDALLLTLDSPDGDQGFPGALHAQVRYVLDGDTVEIGLAATTDAPTVVNLTSHAYFNLAGGGDVLGHELTLAAERYLPVTPARVPTGERAAVAGTPFDFRTPTPVGAHIDDDHPQLRLAGGYDHCFVLAERMRPAPEFAARLQAGGLMMELSTTEPGVQFYSGNVLRGAPHQRRSGLCLETQHFPDSPNQPGFPSTILLPGAAYRSTTRWAWREAG